VVFSALLTGLGAVLALIGPWPLKLLVDNVIQQQTGPWMMQWLTDVARGNRIILMIVIVGGGLLLTLLSSFLGVFNNYVHTRLEQLIVLDFRSRLFQQAQRLSLAFHDQYHSSKLIFAINSQGGAAAAVVLMIPPLAESLLTLVGMLVITYRIDPVFALVALAVVPFLYSSLVYYMTHIERRLREVRGMERGSLSILMEAVSMLRVTLAFGREEHEYRRFRDQSQRAMNARLKVSVGQRLFSVAVSAITATGTALVLGFGTYRVLQGKLSIGQLLVVITYIASVYKPLEAISHTVGSMQQQLVNVQMAFDLLDTEPEFRDPPDAVAIKRAAGHIVFEDVSFAYAGRTETLKNISFEVKPGQVVAIVGPTGAGKSTLVSLLPRFYGASAGRILIDGQDIRKIALKSLRNQFGIVLQEPLLFSGTVAENIRYGRLEATEDEIIESAKAANAHNFIMRLPDGYETVLGEKGKALAGGERQRISVARAFLKNAPILMLDEPTSSIDSKTEDMVLDALDQLMVGRTTFLIAHRLATVRNADFVLVVNYGQIVEQGTQEELLRADGLYRELYDIQMARGRKPRAQHV
jgi:ABC-type multidrug transport system fused ATPase/permease subunit